MPGSLSVCIVTYERPVFVRRCLASLAAQRPELADVVVVDASSEKDETLESDAGFPFRYVWAPELAGWMTRSRNAGLPHLTGEVLAFLDDDVVCSPGWARELLAAYASPDIGAVVGRTRNLQPGEETYDLPIGRLQPDGRLTEGFASVPQGPVDVDHGIGANMSFRADVVAELGGFRDDYPGTAMREDTDMFLRVRALGHRCVFAPDAVVDHLPAPHVRGQRFDRRYVLYARRNHAVLLGRNAGIGSPMLRRWVVAELRSAFDAGSPVRVARRLAMTAAGLGWGLAALPRSARWRALDPRRRRV